MQLQEVGVQLATFPPTHPGPPAATEAAQLMQLATNGEGGQYKGGRTQGEELMRVHN